MDVLTPAAACLNNMSLTTLIADLKGGKTLAQEAGGGSKATDLINCIVAAQKKNLDNEVAAGWITADQETALVTALTTQVTNLVNNGPPVPRTGAKAGGMLQTAATYLGIDVSTLQSDLKSGKSLADVIASLNDASKTVDGLVGALKAPIQAKLDAAVTANRITAAQEGTILSNLTTRLTNLVNHKPGTAAVQNSLRKFGSMTPAAFMRAFFKK
jgi:hypothetical protein